MHTTALFAAVTTFSLLMLAGCAEPERDQGGEASAPPPAPTARPGAPATPSPETTSAAGGPAAAATDEALEQRIRQALNADASLSATAKTVQVDATAGEVTLRGAVANEQEKQTIAAKVQQMEGVKGVNNQLQVAS